MAPIVFEQAKSALPDRPLEGSSVQAALLLRADAWIQESTGGRWRCQRCWPRLDGSYDFAVISHVGGGQLRWHDERAGRQLVMHRGRPAGEVAFLATALAANLPAVLALEPFRLLRWHNRSINVMPFDERIVDALLAARLEHGRRAWFSWRFTGCVQDGPEHFTASFAGPAGRVDLVIGAPGALVASGSTVLAATPWFVLSLGHDGRSPAGGRRLRDQVERHLGFLIHRAVHSALTVVRRTPSPPSTGPQHVGAGAPPGETAGPPSDSTATDGWLEAFRRISGGALHCGGAAELRRMFLYPDLVTYRMEGQHFKLVDHVHVAVADRECYKMDQRPVRHQHRFFVQMPGGSVRPARRPSRLPGRREGGGSGSEPKGRDGGRRDGPKEGPLRVLLGEREVINGDLSRLDVVLEACERSLAPSAVCVVNCSCTPRLIGADVGSVVKRRADASGRRYVLYTETGGDTVTVFQELLRSAYAAAERPGGARAPGEPPRVAFVGPWADGFLEEAQTCLARFGVAVAAAFMPYADERLIDQYRRADLQVIVDGREIRTLLREVFLPLPMETIQVSAPWGVAASAALLEAVIRRVRPDLDVDLGPEVGAVQDQCLALLRAVDSPWIGLVLNGLDVRRLREEGGLVRSLPLLSFLEGLGLRLDILLVGDDRAAARLEEETRTLLEAPERHRIAHWRHDADWVALTERTRCVVSDVAEDTRILSRGALPIGTAHFEMGFGGALRTVARIVRRLSLTYPSRYRDTSRGAPAPLSDEDHADPTAAG